MKKFSLHLSIVVLLFIAVPALLGAVKSPPPAADSEAPVTTPGKPISPMMQEIKATMEANKAAVQELGAQLESAPDESAALQILQTISQQKQDTEIAILRIQERYARQAGDIATADQIKLAVEKILNPDPVTPSAEAMAEREARRSGGADDE